MKALAYTVMVFGALIAILGLLSAFVPIVGVPLMALGGFIVWCGRGLRHKAREQAVNRQLGG